MFLSSCETGIGGGVCPSLAFPATPGISAVKANGAPLLSHILLCLPLCRSPPQPPPVRGDLCLARCPRSTFRTVVPSSPSAGAGRPQTRWLDSREALILQLRPSRLHRWVTTQTRCPPPSALKQIPVFYLFSFNRLCVEGFSPPKRALICTNTRQRRQRAKWDFFICGVR